LGKLGAVKDVGREVKRVSIDDQPTSGESGSLPVLPLHGGQLAPGAVVNGIYRLVRRLGAGGMGEVWEARHERTRGRVAVKVLLPEMGRHEDVLRRFQREVEITSALNHPNIVRVSDADKLPDGRPFLVMELLDGNDLASAASTPLSLPQVLDVVEQIAMGLHAAHGQSVVHRDLKPANIFLVPLPGTTRVVVKILDFGISKALDGLSKLTHTRSVVGTPYYMAPEQARAGISSLDARADQFSLAAVAFELLTGHMAFDGDGMVNVLYKVVQEPPPRFASLGVRAPAGVEAVVLRGLAKEPSDRYATVMAFSEALKKAAGAGVIERNHPPAPAVRGTKPLPAPSVTTLNASTGEIAAAQLSPARVASMRTDPVGPAPTVKTRRRPSAALLVGGAGVVAAAILAVAILRRPALESETVLEPRPAEALHPAPPAPAVQPPTPPPVHDKIVIGSDGQSKVIPAPAGEGARPPRVVDTGAEQPGAGSPVPVATSASAPADPKSQKPKSTRERPPVTGAEARRKPAKAGHRTDEEEGAAAAVQGGQTRPPKSQAPAPPEPPVPLGPTNSAL